MMSFFKIMLVIVSVCAHSFLFGAVVSYEQAHEELRMLKEQRKRVERERDENISYRDCMAFELELAKESHKEAMMMAELFLETMREWEVLTNADNLTEAVAILEVAVANEEEKKSELERELESLISARELVSNKVAEETAELSRLKAKNER